MAEFNTVPKAAKSQPAPYKIHVPEEQVQEMRNLLKVARIGPQTYENLHADPVQAKFGLTREWLAHAKEQWLLFNWRSVEDELNQFPNYQVEIQGFNIHFLALFSSRADAIPVLLLHGWPGSVLEFLPVLRMFKDEYTPSDLPYHFIVPSLPGYGFSSGPPLDRNFTMLEVSEILNALMVNLGFGETGYVSQGGDIGSRLSRFLGARQKACKAVHLNFCIMPKPETMSLDSLDDFERKNIERGMAFLVTENAYAKAHASRPATLGLLVSTSPLALLTWIGEKFLEWTDTTPTMDTILASISLYWLTDSCPRSIYPYRESYGPNPTHHGTPELYIDKPLGYSYFPRDVCPVPVSWAATTGKLCWSKRHAKGGHFAALEQPKEFKEDIEAFLTVIKRDFKLSEGQGTT